MAKNPLDTGDEGGWTGRQPSMTEEDLRQWCAEENRRELAMRADWWFFVRKDDNGRFGVNKLEGWKAREARANARGERIEWYKPTPKDLASINKFVRRAMDNGLSQYEFNELVQRTGGAPRA